MVAFEGYFDESGDFEEEPKIFCVAGYFIDAERAKLMDERWGAVLEEHAIPYFHMVDCAHGVEAFENKGKDERIVIETKMIGLIKEYTASGFAALTKEDVFEQSEAHPRSASRPL
jgi:hypothetical protein